MLLQVYCLVLLGLVSDLTRQVPCLLRYSNARVEAAAKIAELHKWPEISHALMQRSTAKLTEVPLESVKATLKAFALLFKVTAVDVEFGKKADERSTEASAYTHVESLACFAVGHFLEVVGVLIDQVVTEFGETFRVGLK